MATKTTEFPRFIHLTRENEGTGDAFWNVFEGKPEDALTSTESTRVATYELRGVQTGKLSPVFLEDEK